MIKRVIQKLTKSEVTKNSVWLIAERIIQMILSLVVNRIVAEYLQPENYGTLSYAASIVAFFTSLCTLGLDAIIINEIVNKKEEQGEILGTSIFMRIVSSFLSMILIAIVVIFLNPNNIEILIITLLQALTLIFDAFNVINIWYQSKLKSKYTAIIAFIVYIIISVLKVYFVFTNKQLI
jgi:O-antigen/teichoic acid export membrane protein